MSRVNAAARVFVAAVLLPAAMLAAKFGDWAAAGYFLIFFAGPPVGVYLVMRN